MSDALARHATEAGGGAIDAADDAVLEHMAAVADVACLRIGGRRSQIDLVEIIKPADSGVILTDAGVIHDHAAHAPHRRIEGIVPAAIAPGNDEVRSMRVAHRRATGDRQNFCVLKCSHDPLVPQGGYYG